MKWRMGGAIVTAVSLLTPGCWTLPPAPLSPPLDAQADPPRDGVAINRPRNEVIRRDATGQRVWATHLEGTLGGARPPHLLVDAQRVYVTHGDGVTALDRETGKVLWHSRGPNERLLLSNDLLVAVRCDSSGPATARCGRLMARAVATGTEVFQALLPPGYEDSAPLQEIAGLFLVQTPPSGGQGKALLLDRKGQVRHQYNGQIFAGRLRDGGTVFLTNKEVVCLSGKEKIRWSIPFAHLEDAAGGGLVDLGGGDLVAFLYSRVSDSGVQVIRLDPATGQVVWQVCCPPFGALFYTRYSQDVTVRVEGNRTGVTSRGSSGTFVEVLDLETGQRLGRTSGQQ
jgi:outer membrane protein assembly factor BamB